MIKAIIFDVGGVITFTDFQSLYTNFANKSGISPEFVEQYHKDNWEKMLLGNITLKQFFQDMQKAGAKEDLNLESIWLEEGLKIRKLNIELLEVIAKLRENYMVSVLSNLTPTRLIMDEAINLYDHFNFVILSCKEHLKKPDPEFYDLTLKKIGVEAAEAVFVDDKESNVTAARELGLKDILYTDNQKLFNELSKLGVIIN